MLASVGEDFDDVPYNITIPATEEDSNGIFIIPNDMLIIFDDNIDEITQSFALIAQLGSDVLNSFACFQKHIFATECFGRGGVTIIKIVDNDGMYVDMCICISWLVYMYHCYVVAMFIVVVYI